MFTAAKLAGETECTKLTQLRGVGEKKKKKKKKQKARNDLAQIAFLLAIDDSAAAKSMISLLSLPGSTVDTVEDVYARPEFTDSTTMTIIRSKAKLAERVFLYNADGTKDASVKSFVRRMNKVCRPFSRFSSPLATAMLTQFSFYSTSVTESESRYDWRVYGGEARGGN